MSNQPTLREKSLEWFFAKTAKEKENLKNKYFQTLNIPYCSQWNYHFNFGQIEEMYIKECI